LGDRTGGVELAGIAGGLEVLEQLFVNVAEEVAVAGRVKINAVDFVDDLAHEGAVLHIVVGILEGGADEGVHALAASEGFQSGQEGVVDEIKEGVAGDAFLVLRPGGPADVLRQRGFVCAAQELHLLLAGIQYFEKEHPAELLQALGVAVGAGILAHDILNGLDEV